MQWLAFFCVEGISQAEMLAFLFDAAHECEKLAKRASHRCVKTTSHAGALMLTYGDCLRT